MLYIFGKLIDREKIFYMCPIVFRTVVHLTDQNKKCPTLTYMLISLEPRMLLQPYFVGKKIAIKENLAKLHEYFMSWW